MNNRNLFPTVLETRKYENKAQAEFMSGGTCLLAHRQPSSLCVLTWQKVWDFSLGSLNKSTNPIREGSILMSTSRRPHFQIPPHWGLGFNVWIWRDTKLQSTASTMFAVLFGRYSSLDYRSSSYSYFFHVIIMNGYLILVHFFLHLMTRSIDFFPPLLC